MKRLMIAAMAALVLAGCGDLGGGEKIGVIMKVGQRGLLCKTNEVELMRGGLNNGTGATGAVFHATVEDPSLLQKLKDAMESQSEVKLTYHEELTTFCRSESSDYFVTSVEVAHPVGVARPAPVEVSGTVHTAPATTRDQKIVELLTLQSKLLQELAQGNH